MEAARPRLSLALAPALAFALALVAGPLAGSAWAHAFLKTATPAVGGTVRTPPGEVVIAYSEAVEPAFSTIEVTDQAGVRVDIGPARVAPGDGQQLIVALRPVPAGTYQVVWHVTAVDTHRTTGAYRFTVSP